jgi:hypothetical protein
MSILNTFDNLLILMTLLLPRQDHLVKLLITPSNRSFILLLRQHKFILMLESSPLFIPKALQPLLLPLHIFTLRPLMFHRILLEPLYTRECRPFPDRHNQLRDIFRLGGNHHLVDRSLPDDNHPIAGLPLQGDNHLFMFLSEDNLPLLVKPRLLIHLWQGGNLLLSETLRNPGEYL